MQRKVTDVNTSLRSRRSAWYLRNSAEASITRKSLVAPRIALKMGETTDGEGVTKHLL